MKHENARAEDSSSVSTGNEDASPCEREPGSLCTQSACFARWRSSHSAFLFACRARLLGPLAFQWRELDFREECVSFSLRESEELPRRRRHSPLPPRHSPQRPPRR